MVIEYIMKIFLGKTSLECPRAPLTERRATFLYILCLTAPRVQDCMTERTVSPGPLPIKTDRGAYETKRQYSFPKKR